MGWRYNKKYFKVTTYQENIGMSIRHLHDMMKEQWNGKQLQGRKAAEFPRFEHRHRQLYRKGR